MSFVPLPSPYDDIPQMLTSAVPEFAASDEYKMLLGIGEDLPGVVLSAFGSFLARLAIGDPSDAVLAKGIAIVSALWEANDSQIQTSLEDEFFEALDLEPKAVPLISELMRPQLREGHSRWATRSF